MRILSYNIHKGIGGVDRRYNLDRVCRVIEHEKPDIICLQEVTRNAVRTLHHDQPQLLAQAFAEYHWCFQMNVRYKVGGYGNMLLSRWPFHEQHHLCLRHMKRKPRGAQVVIVDTPAGHLRLTNWHLGLAERERHWQVDRLLRHPTLCPKRPLPSVIVGDFNDWRNTLAKGPFARHDFAEATAPTKMFRSFPAFWGVFSLDKAFYRGDVAVDHVRIVRTKLAYFASDHLPLVLDIQIKNGAT
jgi:endonuclease/exonuclease/phosphatase family metal-dependent hydrolase